METKKRKKQVSLSNYLIVLLLIKKTTVTVTSDLSVYTSKCPRSHVHKSIFALCAKSANVEFSSSNHKYQQRKAEDKKQQISSARSRESQILFVPVLVVQCTPHLVPNDDQKRFALDVLVFCMIFVNHWTSNDLER